MLRGSFDDVEWYARELMRLPFEFEVREPEALRAQVVEQARELARDHGERSAARRAHTEIP